MMFTLKIDGRKSLKGRIRKRLFNALISYLLLSANTTLLFFAYCLVLRDEYYMIFFSFKLNGYGKKKFKIVKK